MGSIEGGAERVGTIEITMLRSRPSRSDPSLIGRKAIVVLAASLPTCRWGVIGRVGPWLRRGRDVGGSVTLAREGHELSILNAAVERERGAQPRSNVSMTIMRPPQHGHGWTTSSGSPSRTRALDPFPGIAAVSSSRARATEAARVPLANRP